MKKILTILCSAVMLMTISSCTKQYVQPVTNQNLTLVSSLTSNDWTAYTDGSGSKSYTSAINVKQLDDNSLKYDGVIVSISYDNGQTYEQLPEVYGGTSFSYTYSKGELDLYAQSSDGGTAILPTDPIKVKIVLVYSDSF